MILINEEAEYTYFKGEINFDIALTTLQEEIEVGTYIRTEIHGLINPHFYFENTIETVFLEENQAAVNGIIEVAIAPVKTLELVMDFSDSETATEEENKNDGQSNLFKHYAETMFEVDLLFYVDSISTSEVLEVNLD